MRYRSEITRESARHLQHMQKALLEMNLKRHHVFSDLDGYSALQIIEAILTGERDPEVLWKLRDKRVKATKDTFLKSMEANWQDTQLFILKQKHQAWSHTHDAIKACDQEIETALTKIESDTDQDPPAPTNSKKGRGKNRIQAN